MVTHNPELAEKYSSRIIKILDGKLIEDSNPIGEEEKLEDNTNKIGRTSMKFWTAFRLSLNNLLTKKGRTILVAFAGSIGIIGIALVQSVSNGFQRYVNHIEEDTLTSYPLTIMQETTDVTGALLSMTTTENSSNDSKDEVKEEQYISKMLANLSTNDLKSFKDYIEKNYNEIKNDISSIKYSYSVEPMIYGIDTTGRVAKLNPSNLFESSFGTASMMGMTMSTYSQMMDDKNILNKSYDVLAGRWPENYDEMIIVLSQRGSISDFLLYSLGLRDTEELKDIVNKIMSGEKVDIKNEAIVTSYEDLMNTELKLIMRADTYKYNQKYGIYEDMLENEEFLKKTYENAINLKIVGVVSAKEGVTTAALNPGVAYTSKLVDYIIDYSSKTDIVKKQIDNADIDVLSGKRFDAPKEALSLDFSDMMAIDTNKLQKAFNINIDQKKIEKESAGYITEINKAITTDIMPASSDFENNLKSMAKEMFDKVTGEVSINDVDTIVNNYLNESGKKQIFSELEKKYVIPSNIFKDAYSGLLKGLLEVYINAYYTATSALNPSLDPTAIPTAVINDEMLSTVMTAYLSSVVVQKTIEQIGAAMTEASMKKTILTKVGELTANLTSSFAKAFNVDEKEIAGAFQTKLTEEEITRIVTAMLSDKKTSAKINLINFGYQEKDEPTYISFYFTNFDGKENFKDFVNSYNEKVKKDGQEEKEINYTDTTGILMGSVKTIVNAVTYVLIAFVSISLVVSSIMIGIITYISVYERTKEIGILRAIGASKRNISSIFNAETFIIGLLSGLFGIGTTYLVVPVINKVLHHFTGNIPLNATFYAHNAITLVILSIILTLIGGLIPAKSASKKDPVIALRTE